MTAVISAEHGAVCGQPSILAASLAKSQQTAICISQSATHPAHTDANTTAQYNIQSQKSVSTLKYKATTEQPAHP